MATPSKHGFTAGPCTTDPRMPGAIFGSDAERSKVAATTPGHAFPPRTLAEAKANAELIAEAFTAAHETGLTPRQLAERCKELLTELRKTDDIVDAASAHLRRCAVLLSEAGDAVSASNVLAWIDNVTRRDRGRTELIVQCQIDAAIAKAQEGGAS